MRERELIGGRGKGQKRMTEKGKREFKRERDQNKIAEDGKEITGEHQDR